MNFVELKEKSLDDLLILVVSLKKDIFKINNHIYLNKSNKSHLVNELKKDLARVNTLIKEKKLSE